MNINGPIIVIEDDLEDQFLIGETFKNLPYDNEVLFFEDGIKAMEFLDSTDSKPLLILSDINMPKMSGQEIRDIVHNHEQPDIKCIPYLFFTTDAHRESVMDAYSSSIQGFFKKPASYEDFENTIRTIVDYWKGCISPAEYF
ncbi:response regulator [Dyadobacter sp. CY356]|uniref:response regulator n=1 Tax=Dyadobacter sp. CY356 TaxID=2906442 RepID=UPI001F285CB9|nr:response regulator [Dyadobacter sp. CY356]MCF0059079.1 response regulator [Dyadobacter sp. CY356]